jgi:hypothetical protein
MDRSTRYLMHGRVQVALSSLRVLTGRGIDVGIGGISVLLDDQIPTGAPCTLRFELQSQGKTSIVAAACKVVYGVFASQGGFRVGFEFTANDPQRTALIEALSGRKVGTASASKDARGAAKAVDPVPATVTPAGD